MIPKQRGRAAVRRLPSPLTPALCHAPSANGHSSQNAFLPGDPTMRHLSIHVATLAALAAVSLAGCATPAIDVALRAQQLELSGDVGASDANSVTTTNASQLGLADDPVVVSPRVDLVGGPLHLTVDGLLVDYDGEGSVDADFTLGGVTIAQNSQVLSRLDLGLTRATATFTLLPLSVVDIGLGLGLAFVEFEAELEETNTNEVVRTSELAPVPYLAARASTSYGPVDADLLVGVLDVDVGDIEVRYLDVELLARVKLLNADVHVQLVGGYRWIGIEVAYDDGDDRVRADLELDGPFLGLSIGF